MIIIYLDVKTLLKEPFMTTVPSKPLSIAVFGAAGDVGKRIVAEATSRGHRVTAVVRRERPSSEMNPAVSILVRDVQEATDLTNIAKRHDLVISALRPADGEEAKLVKLASKVVEASRTSGTRFMVIGGAAPLLIPNSPHHTVLTAPDFLPEAYLPIANACQELHDWILPKLGATGTHLCPPAMLVPGERTGTYRVSDDTLVVDDEGSSHISMEDFAVAAIDEAEHPRHSGRRYTVGT